MHEAFSHITHRTAPLPDIPWIMAQTWSHVLFMHWPVNAVQLQRFLPEELTVDTYKGTAWIGLVTFQVQETKFRSLLPLQFLRPFPQLNIRTYVQHKGIPAVYFFSLDVTHLPSILGARTLYGLPFRKADMSFSSQTAYFFQSSCVTEEKREELDISYTPVSAGYIAEPGAFEHWTIERYALFTKRRNKLFLSCIHHTPWKLQEAKADIQFNTAASFLPRSLFIKEPIAHFADRKEAVFFPPQKA
ncbi:YqjF family protein [Bacillus thermotolerans]|uniref:YqjF family protein n=1 Tax=Bacillus thermotolerans TaxID=1221996 RepID=UPI000591DEBD|nr:DUF2071 domain-containing protein [Bacillus thermotolerans]KKB41584.1 hypothetical protein QY96_01947 [Bacillus thermotolerans]